MSLFDLLPEKSVPAASRTVERPIVLSRVEVEFLLAADFGAQLQLRRVVSLPRAASPYYNRFPERWHDDFPAVAPAREAGWVFWTQNTPASISTSGQLELEVFTRMAYKEGLRCPFAEKGSLMWARESWAAISPDEFERPLEECQIEYRADGDWSRFPGNWPPEFRSDPERPRWRSPVSMPRWASRLAFRVFDVWPERLQTITEEEAGKEGCASVEEYQKAWDDLHDKKNPTAAHIPWRRNPWVWAISFRKVAFTMAEKGEETA